MNPDELQESGLLLVDKPLDWTSHDVVQCVRRRFRVKKVGHCGTLDPAATGLLILVLGKATKLSNNFTNHAKVYSGTMRLGICTDSHDSEGAIVRQQDCSDISEADIREIAAQFVGPIMQVPPMVSAIKVNGKALYKLARKGETIEREPRPITIESLEIGRIAMPDVDFQVKCSKGTYVRSLCFDIGEALGCGAYLLALRRLASGPFQIDAAHSIDSIKTWEREQLFANMLPLTQVFSYLN